MKCEARRATPSIPNKDLSNLPVPSLPPKPSNMRASNSAPLSQTTFSDFHLGRASTPVASTKPLKINKGLSRITPPNQKPKRQLKHEEPPKEVCTILKFLLIENSLQLFIEPLDFQSGSQLRVLLAQSIFTTSNKTFISCFFKGMATQDLNIF